MKKISLSPEVLAALNAESDKPLETPSKPLSDKTIQVIQKQIAKALFGPSIKPTFKQQLLTSISFIAIKAGWAADHWQRMQVLRASR